jgi:hypothetical protein
MVLGKKKISNQLSLKITLLFSFLLIVSSDLSAQSISKDGSNKIVDGGIGLGSIIAVVASWSRNKSILFAILHGLLGWIYVVYFVFTREDSN